jgi:hypothetical protein
MKTSILKKLMGLTAVCTLTVSAARAEAGYTGSLRLRRKRGLLKKIFLGCAASALCAIPAQADNIIWNGAPNDSWSDATSWQGDKTPVAGDTAFFTADSTAGLVNILNGPATGNAPASGIVFDSGGWELNGFFSSNETLLNNTGSNTIRILSTKANGTANWNIETDSSLTIKSAERYGSTYSIHIGNNESGTLIVGGGGTLILDAGIFAMGNNKTRTLRLKDSISLVITVEQIFNTLTPSQTSYVIDSADASLSIKTNNLDKLNEYVAYNQIINNTGDIFSWTPDGDFYTYAIIPEPSPFVLFGLGLLTLVILRRKPRKSANR